MTYKILIAAGGSGGHLYPAMGVAAELIKQDPNIELMFAAGGLDNSPFFDRKAFAWESISSASLNIPFSPLHKRNSFKLMKSCFAILMGLWQSYRILSAFKPDLVIGFGSYHIYPVLLAAQLMRYPIALHEQNSKPGKVISLFSKRALITGVYFPTAIKALKGKSSLLAMPLRPGFSRNAYTKEEACSYFGLDFRKRTVLVFGGSQGAKFINNTIAPILAIYSNVNQSFQILHFAGNSTEAEQVASIYADLAVLNPKVVVKPSESRMDLAWRAADLAIVRAGAGTIAEQIEFEVPAIFVPYPHGDGHQEGNADYVVDNLGGGWKMKESNWQESQFLALLDQILKKNIDLLKTKQKNLALHKNNASRQEFTWVIQNLLKKL